MSTLHGKIKKNNFKEIPPSEEHFAHEGRNENIWAGQAGNLFVI